KVFKENADGSLTKVNVSKRPGTVAIASAIQSKYHIPAVPHVVCKGFTKEETEYALIDLQYLGVTELLLLRGDIKTLDSNKIDASKTHEHASGLIQQAVDFNNSKDVDGNVFDKPETPVSFGGACYP
ncbi:methylenetetrahydrofolate reductase, partial [Candidatus Symbiothrix dinenymphae]|uniref:methylenetetrahydrofolate reductase n=1 Tax=Candidatus Symbiothrix dinenymphae TaxID=467085 RepID=UPI000A7D528B